VARQPDDADVVAEILPAELGADAGAPGDLENFFLEAEVRTFDDEGIARSWLAGDED